MISQPIIYRIIPLYDMPSVFKDECSSKKKSISKSCKSKISCECSFDSNNIQSNLS